MSHDFRQFTISFADRELNSFQTTGAHAVGELLKFVLTPPQSCLISIRLEKTEDFLVACDGDKVGMFHWDGAKLKAYLGGAAEPAGPMRGLIDQRWIIIYFLPDNAYLPVPQAIEAVMQYFDDDSLPLVDVPQNTAETIAIYEGLKAKGAFGNR